jgi:hypothetical protein
MTAASKWRSFTAVEETPPRYAPAPHHFLD